MRDHSPAISQQGSLRPVFQFKNGKMAVAYLVLLLIPFPLAVVSDISPSSRTSTGACDAQAGG